MAGKERSTQDRRCVVCGARLAPDNTSGACASHPRYDPRHDPNLERWLLRLLRKRRGRPVHPLRELRRVGKVCAPTRDARDAINDRIETLRRKGHYIQGKVGQAGGYVYVSGPNDERVQKPKRKRQ